jgi:hypothetical protein
VRIALASPMQSGPAVMKDIVFVVVAIAFFGVSWLYTAACERV